MLGTALKQAGDLDGAMAALQEALKLNPDTPGPYNTMAQILRVRGDLEGSRKAFAEGARVKKQKEGEQAAMFNVNTGLKNLRDGKLEVATQQLRAAIAAAPQPARAHRGLAEALERKGERSEAEKQRKLADELELTAPRAQSIGVVRGPMGPD